MPDETIIAQCSPTLAGIKTGSLFTTACTDRKACLESIRRLNSILVPKGARIIPLRFGKEKVLLYLYRPKKLQADLMDPKARQILCEKNYPCISCEKCVAELMKRLRLKSKEDSKDFPHEIGLFLGYPSADVEHFINDGPRSARMCGIWKVYQNVEEAQNTFRKYKKCNRVYMDAYRKHNSLEKLVVNC